MSGSYPDLLADQLVLEVKVQMARQGVPSSRALGQLINRNSQYMSQRLDGGSATTGLRIPLNIRDLAAISAALGILASELVRRAEAAIDSVGIETN